MNANRDSRILVSVVLLLFLGCLNASVDANDANGVATAIVPGTSEYVFMPGQSTITQTGGIAGVHRIYAIAGRFQLVVDPNAGTASFQRVDANAVDDSPFKHTLDPNEVFNMTHLTSTTTSGGAYQFKGQAHDGSAVLITLSFKADSVVLAGQTTPPPNSADFFLFTLSAAAQRKYAGGTGEPNDPYQIATAADLIALGEDPNDYDKHFILTADIDLDPNLPGCKVFDKAVIAPGTQPIDQYSGFGGTPFTGVFDGNDHIISHLTIKGKECLGLFGLLGAGGGWWPSPANVKNLGVVDVDITGSGDTVGGLAGGLCCGSLTQCYSSGNVAGASCVGGLVGQNGYYDKFDCNGGRISGCYSLCTVTGGRKVGGMVGYNTGGIDNCYSAGSARGEESIGGLVGDNAYYELDLACWPVGCGGCGGAISYSYSVSNVSANTGGGGLVGVGGGAVYLSFWDTQTSGQAESDGGTAKTTAEMQTIGTFLNWGTCANAGIWTISEGNDYPRLWWEHRAGKPIRLGMLSDFLRGTGTESDPFLIYTAQDIDTILKFPCEQDKYFRLMFVSGEGTQDDPYLVQTIEQINLLNLCPYERSAYYRLGFLAGEGTQENPYLIYTGDELTMLGRCPYELDKHFKLPADIDLDPNIAEGRVFNQAVVPTFRGVFDGNGHTLSHLTIKGVNYVGLVGQLVSGAEIRNLGVVDVNIVGSGSYVGGLVGSNRGTVTDCYSTGTISGYSFIGGLVGENDFRGRIAKSYSTGTISGYWAVGGLVGYNYYDALMTQCYSTATVSGERGIGGLLGWNGNYGTVTNCYSTGTVSGSESIGGLVGGNGIWEGNAWVAYCYSTSVVNGTGKLVGGLVGNNGPWYQHVGVVTSGLWDMQTSGQINSAGGTGKTTAEMQTADTFLDAGWDFVGIWWIDEGRDYPRLWWETKSGL